MSIRSASLIRLHVPTGATDATLLVPEGFVVLVKELHVSADTVDSQFLLRVYPPDASWFVALAMGAITDGHATWTGTVVINPADFLQLQLSGTNVRGWVSGSVLQGTPWFEPATQSMADLLGPAIEPLPAPPTRSPRSARPRSTPAE